MGDGSSYCITFNRCLTMARKVTSRSQTITANTTLMPDGFSGWLCKNIGTANVEVDGYVLEPGQMLDYHDILPDVEWGSPITIIVQSGGSLRITRLQYAGEDE